MLLFSLICPWHCWHGGTETGAASFSRHLKLPKYPGDVESLQGSFCSPALKRRTSADSSQPEGASLESCCSASSAHGTAGTEAQTLVMLPFLATANFQRTLRGACQAPPASLLQKCECLQIVRRKKGLAWNAFVQPHLPMALLARRHRDWGCFLFLTPQTSKVSGGCGITAGLLLQPCSEKANICR